MSDSNQSKNRYSDQELEEFRILIEQKLEKAINELNFFLGQIQEIADSMGGGGDWMDDTSSRSDLEMLSSRATRHRRHIQDLENALLRIRNKSYGICVVSGELIDKRRLMAVPTTTKSLAAKTIVDAPKEKKERTAVVNPKNSPPKVITKIIRKPKTTPPPVKEDLYGDDDDELDTDFLEGIKDEGDEIYLDPTIFNEDDDDEDEDDYI